MAEGDPRIEALARIADGFGKIETFTRMIQTSAAVGLQPMLQPLITDLTTKLTAATADLTEIKDDIAEASRKSDYTQMLEDSFVKTTEELEILRGIEKEAEIRKGEADNLWAKQEENKKSLERAQREAETWKGQADEWKASFERAEKEADARKGQADEWRSKNYETKASLERVEKEAETWKGEADKWQSSHDEIKASLERVRCEAETRKGEVDELQSKNDETSTCLERAEREAEILKGEVDRWKSEHGEIETSLERVQDEAEIRKDEADARLRELSEDLEQCQEDLSLSKGKLKDHENATLAKESELEELLARSLADYEAASSSLRQNRKFYGICISARNKLEADIKKLRRKLTDQTTEGSRKLNEDIQKLRDSQTAEIAAKDEKYENLFSASQEQAKNLEAAHTVELERLHSEYATELSGKDGKYSRLCNLFDVAGKVHDSRAGELARLREEHRVAYTELDTRYSVALASQAQLRGHLTTSNGIVQTQNQRIDSHLRRFEWLNAEEPSIRDGKPNRAWFNAELRQLRSDLGRERTQHATVQTALQTCRSELKQVKTSLAEREAEVATAATEAIQIEDNLAEVSRKSGVLQSELTEVKGSLMQRDQELSAVHSALQERVVDLESQRTAHVETLSTTVRNMNDNAATARRALQRDLERDHAVIVKLLESSRDSLKQDLQSYQASSERTIGEVQARGVEIEQTLTRVWGKKLSTQASDLARKHAGAIEAKASEYESAQREALDAEKLRCEVILQKALQEQEKTLNARSRSMISELQKEFDQKLAIKDKEVSDTAAPVTQLQGELGSLRISHNISHQELQQQLRRAAGDLETSRQRTEFLERSMERVKEVATAHETSEGVLRSEVEQLRQQLATAKRLSLSTTRADMAGSRVTEPLVETSTCADDEQVDRRPTKRKRTAGTEASDASLTLRPQMAQSDARTKASEIRALMKPQWSISDKEEETLMDQLTSLFSKKAKVSDKLQAIDRCVVGILNAEPPNLRPCLLALLVRRNGGEGGPQMTSLDCPYCTERPDERICCYATYAEGVASAFGVRVDGKVKDTRWNEKPEPYTDEQEVRFLLHKRACGDL